MKIKGEEEQYPSGEGQRRETAGEGWGGENAQNWRMLRIER